MESYTSFTLTSSDIVFEGELSKIKLQGQSYQNSFGDTISYIEVAMLLKPSTTSLFNIEAPLTNIDSNYLWNTQARELKIQSFFRACQPGEVFNPISQNGYYECKICKDNTFSIVIPTTFE